MSLVRSKPGHLRSFGDFMLWKHDLTLPHAVRARESNKAVFDYYRSQLPTLRQDLEPLQSSVCELQDLQSGAASALLASERSAAGVTSVRAEVLPVGRLDTASGSLSRQQSLRVEAGASSAPTGPAHGAATGLDVE